jgi:hypothetical protein
MNWIDLAQDRDPVEGSCEHGNETLGSIKCWEVLEWLYKWRLLKKGSAPWTSLLHIVVLAKNEHDL